MHFSHTQADLPYQYYERIIVMQYVPCFTLSSKSYYIQQTSIKAFFNESNAKSEQATGSTSVDHDPSDDSDPDCEADVDTQSGGASGYEQNESEYMAVTVISRKSYFYSLISQAEELSHQEVW